ncbi:MAG: hypothetical protein ACPL7B_12530, partial [Candidatus Poribacteria bacterium]
MNLKHSGIIIFLVLAIYCLIQTDQTSAEDQKYTLKAFLMSPFEIQGKSYGKAGQIINYSENKERNGYIIEVDNKTFGSIGSYGIIPCDPSFTMSWLYLLVSKNEIFEIIQMKDLIKSILATFPSHPLYEEIFAVLLLERGGY